MPIYSDVNNDPSTVARYKIFERNQKQQPLSSKIETHKIVPIFDKQSNRPNNLTSVNNLSHSLHTMTSQSSKLGSTQSASLQPNAGDSDTGNYANVTNNCNNSVTPGQREEVKLESMPWFHGKISREVAEWLLKPRSDGLFLVRESQNFPGDYTLCVCHKGQVQHYRVHHENQLLSIDSEEYFENLSSLVKHYEQDADGLCTQLVLPLPKKGKLEFCVHPSDFIKKGWAINKQELECHESIGKGEFGDVLLGTYKGKKVAVKMLKDNSEQAQRLLTEASLMTSLNHPNLVNFIGIVFNNNHMYLVTEYMSKGSLVDYLRSRGRLHVSKEDQINFAYDTCAGMAYLESCHVIHRDLAARNVLIADDNTAKVSDFGLARDEKFTLDGGKLPIKWTAPEALKRGNFSNKSDVWSFGILLWEIYSFGRVPYPRLQLADVVKNVEKGHRMDCPDGCPPEIYELMLSAWNLNPDLRPNFSDLKKTLLRLRTEYMRNLN